MPTINSQQQIYQQPQQLVQSNPYLYYPQVQPMYQQQIQNQAQLQQNQSQQTVASDRVWAQGENAAKAYMVAKNTEQVIWDSEQPVIYIKTVDIYGRPSMITLDYTIRPVESQNNGIANSEVNDLKNELNELRNDLKAFIQNSQQQQRNYNPKYNKKEVANNES